MIDPGRRKRQSDSLGKARRYSHLALDYPHCAAVRNERRFTVRETAPYASSSDFEIRAYPIVLYAVFLGPGSELIEHIERGAAEVGYGVGDRNGPRTEDASLEQPDLLHFLEALIHHLFAGTTELPGEIIEAHGTVFQVPKYRAFPLATEKPHAAFYRARLEAGFHDEFATVFVDLYGGFHGSEGYQKYTG